MEPDLRFEDEPAAIPEDEVLRGLEVLRAVLLPNHETPVPGREVHLHRADRGPRREAGLLLGHQQGHAGELREPRHRGLPVREVPAVQVEPPLQEVLPRLVHDLPVREVRLPPPLDELVRVPPELERDLVLRGLPREVRHQERVPVVREHDVRVELLHRRVELLEDLGLAPAHLDVPDPRAEELVLEPRDPEGRVHAEVEEGGPKLRERVVESELLLLRPPLAVAVPQEAEREDPVLQAVPLAEPQVHVVQRVVVVPAVRVDDLRDILELAVVTGHDLEDGDRVLAPDVHPPLDLADFLHLVEDLEAFPHPWDLLRRGSHEERRLEGLVLDAVGALLVPEPEDDCVLVVVRIRVDEPALRGWTPPWTERFGGGRLRRGVGGRWAKVPLRAN